MTDANNSRVYSAVYSSVPVYEMICRGIAVMKRSKDSWLNATQILKVAGIDKGRRTKILEREVLGNEHEKVQGGYGKYQGTWVPYDRGLQLCKQFNVIEQLKPIIEHSPKMSENGEDQTPTKAQLKQKLIHEQKNPFKRNILINSKKKKELPNSSQMIPPGINSSGKRPRDQVIDFNLESTPVNNNLTAQNFKYNSNNLSSQFFHPYNTQTNQNISSNLNYITTQKENFFSQKSLNPSTPTTGASRVDTPTTLSTVVNHSHQGNIYSSEDLDYDKKLLISLFMNEDPSYIPEWLSKSKSDTEYTHYVPKSLNIVIDDEGNTAVHWAAALARIEALDLLLLRGADATVLNYHGESTLSKAVKVLNNYENQVFPDLLELLHDGIPLTDKKNRSVLHHIVLCARIEGHYQASIYYMECLLGWVSRLSNGFVVEPESYSAFDTPLHNKLLTSCSSSQNSVSESKTSTIGNDLSKTLYQDLNIPRNNDRYDSGSHLSENNTVSPLNEDSKLTGHSSLLTPRSQSQQINGCTQVSSESKMSQMKNDDILLFLNLQDENGDTALNIATQDNDRALIQLLHSAGASFDIANCAGIKSSDLYDFSLNLRPTSASNADQKYQVGGGSDFIKRSRRSLNSSNLNSFNANDMNKNPSLHSSAPSTTHTNRDPHDLFISPTKKPSKINNNLENSSVPHNFKTQMLEENHADLRSSRNLAPNLELVSKGSPRNLSSSLPNIAEILKNSSNLDKNSSRSEDNQDSNINLKDTNFILSLDNIGSNQGKNILNVIRDLMDDLEREFKKQLLQKQEKHANLVQQLKSTVNELSSARETISEMSFKLNQMEKLDNDKSHLSRTLENLNSDERYKTCKDNNNLISDTNSNEMSQHTSYLESNLVEGLIQVLLDTAGKLSKENMSPNILNSGFCSSTEHETFDLTKKYVANIKRKMLNHTNEHRISNAIEEFIDQICVRNSHIFNYVSSMKSHYESKNSYFKNALSNLLEISESDIELWLQKIMIAVESRMKGGEGASTVLSEDFKDEINNIMSKSSFATETNSVMNYKKFTVKSENDADTFVDSSVSHSRISENFNDRESFFIAENHEKFSFIDKDNQKTPKSAN
ncbi:hypothetical protein BB561_000122 [Smittium simulii]|uniref:HTH APSES-type domain-containing protein n=1 Tax=Smittium simulii TaxID=133385 RepID=A0A2T9Z0P8_9FUNG|nr:hypothetical protein BB561_000122 [Smittium simulii]